MNGVAAPESDEWTPVSGVDPQVDEWELPDLDVLAELTHPVRARVLRLLDQPRTVAEIADRLAVPVTRLYHHVNRLEALGLIRVVATRRVGAATERRYQTIATSFRVARQLRESSDPHEFASAVGAVFDVAKMSFQRTLERRESPNSPEEYDNFLSLLDIKLTSSSRTLLLERLGALVEECARLDDDDENASAFTLFIAAAPGTI